MPERNEAQNRAVVTINNVALTPIEVDGVRVVTLGMIDEVHGRPSGTARKRFNDNRERMTDGKHCFVRKTDEAAAMGFTAPNGLTLMTERGYLMLVKSFTDDLAWQVQAEKERAAALEARTLADAPKVEALDRLAAADGSFCITDAAKALGIRPKDLFNYMRGPADWIFRRLGCSEDVAYSGKLKDGLLINKTFKTYRSDGTEKAVTRAYVTPKGLTKLAMIFNEQDRDAAA